MAAYHIGDDPMNRRDFLGGAVAASVPASLQGPNAAPAADAPAASSAAARLPDAIAGMSPSQLAADYHERLFNRYLPFWEKGGCDRQHGGIMCELNDDGSVANDEKFIWYQGRAIWVYSFLYSRFGKDLKRAGVSTKRKDNFHQARYMMLDLLSLRRMIANQGRPTPFSTRSG
jgi:N-acylglucosamine 2-epimerase